MSLETCLGSLCSVGMFRGSTISILLIGNTDSEIIIQDPGTAATVAGISSLSNIFHPTKDGHTAYEKVLKAHILGQPAPGPLSS